MVDDIHKHITELRESGRKLAEISKITGKSIYYVYSRLNQKYRLGRLESRYILDKVIPTLKNMGFKDIELENQNIHFRGDIIAKKDGFTHVFEVKKDCQRSLICFALGEIILSQIENERLKGKKKYHIIVPPDSSRKTWTKKESLFLKKRYGIDIITI